MTVGTAGAVSITSFLDGLSSGERDTLYTSPWTCQAVFRSLPPVAQALVLDLLLLDQPVPQDLLLIARCADSNVYGGSHRAAVQRLQALGILGQVQGPPPHGALRLHATFQAQLRAALASGGRGLMQAPAALQDVAAATPALPQLDAWAHKQWEALQMYLLEPSSAGPRLPPDLPLRPLDIHALLVSAGWVTGSIRARAITDSGFQFLLQDSHRQLWAFLAHYITSTSSSSLATAAKAGDNGDGGGAAPLISFLMQLGFMRVGAPYALGALSSREAAVAGHMMQLGLLMPFDVPRRGGHYCPTRLASSLCGGDASAAATTAAAATTVDIAGGHIVVESNFKVNAWTTSRVQRALLGLFCRVEACLPNFWVGSLTPDSVASALASGISADEIINYLGAHAHPVVLAAASKGRRRVRGAVPENVADQVRLWEAEGARLRASPAVFYDAFESLPLYEGALAFARDHGWLLWANPATKAFAAAEAGHAAIRDTIRALKAASSSAGPG